MYRGSMGDPDEYNHREEMLYQDNNKLKRENQTTRAENDRLKFRIANYEKAYAGYTVVYVTREPRSLAYYIEDALSIEEAKSKAHGRLLMEGDYPFVTDPLDMYVFKGKSLPL